MPAALVAVIFVAYYRRWLQFGLYSDDHALFGGAILRSWSEALEHAWFCLTRWPQGRPLGKALNLGLIPHVVFKLGGLPGLHLAGFAVLAANTTLLYRLIVRGFPKAVAFAGAAFFALSPAATVQLQLVYAYSYGIATLAGLLATQAALDRRPVLFAAWLAVAFTMAEPVVMFALLAPPILTFRLREGWTARALRHVLLWGAVVVLLLVARRLVGVPGGEERVGEMTAAPLRTLQRAIESATTGPVTYASLLALRLPIPVRELDFELATVMAACALLAFGALAWTNWRARASQEVPQEPKPALGAAVLVAAGLLTMMAVYFTYFRWPWYPANWRQGFMSGVHIVPALSGGLLAAGVVQLAHATLPARFRWATLLPVAAVLALLGGFGEIVQREFVSSWEFQKGFWQGYRSLCRDATEGTYVLVLDRNLPNKRFVDLFSWGSEILPGALFDYRKTQIASETTSSSNPDAMVRSTEERASHVIRRPPVVILTGPDPAGTISYDGMSYHWKESYYFMLPKAADEQPRDGNVILLERRPDGWRRIEGFVPVDGGALALRPATGNLLDHVPATTLARIYGL